MKESIVRSFKKCGLSVALDGSEDQEVNIEGILNYQMPKSFGDESQPFTLLDDDDDESDGDEESSNEEESDGVVYDFIYDKEIPLAVES